MNLTVTKHDENGEPCGAAVVQIQERATTFVWRPTEIEIQVTDTAGASPDDIDAALRAHYMWAGSGNVITNVKYI